MSHRGIAWAALGAVTFWIGSEPAFSQLPPTPTAQPTGRGPRLFVAQRIQELGTVLEGDKVDLVWTLENRGDADLVIERTSAACGCTVVQLSDNEKVIPPGKSLNLRAQFDSTARREDQAKSILVISNDPTEPELKLEFRAKVEVLFELDPPNLLNVRAVRRGVASTRTLDIYPGPGRKSLTLRELNVADDGPISLSAEPFQGPKGAGQRVKVTVLESASIGSLDSTIRVKVDVDGIERERTVAIRGEVTADLTWLPKVVDATRQTSLPGKKFAPVVVSAAEKSPFEITSAAAGPLLDVAVEPGKKPEAKTEYAITLALRSDAPPGPFAALLRIHTTSLDQPILEVPVFGIVASAVEIEPPLVLLRGDGTGAGSTRRVKLQASGPSQTLEVKSIACDDPTVVARVDKEASSEYVHLQFLEVKLIGEAAEKSRQTVVRVETTVPGAERLEIPVRIEGKGAASND